MPSPLATEILALIIAVDPKDNDGLRVIDEKVCEFLGTYPKPISRYSTSRDVLKTIRPKGWVWDFSDFDGQVGSCWAEPFEALRMDRVEVINLKTTELAELHAIIEVIDLERSRNGHGMVRH